MDDLHHECGIAAIYQFQNPAPSRLTRLAGQEEQASRLMPRMLLDLQHRGQLAARMSPWNPRREHLLDTFKQIGVVIEALRLNPQAKHERSLRQPAGRA